MGEDINLLVVLSLHLYIRYDEPGVKLVQMF